MSTVKKVQICGTMTFDASPVAGGDAKDSMKVLMFLGQMALPSYGLKIEFQSKPKMVPNTHGGKTAMYEYEINGEEAIALSALEAVVHDLKKVGTVSRAMALDIENKGDIVNLNP